MAMESKLAVPLLGKYQKAPLEEPNDLAHHPRPRHEQDNNGSLSGQRALGFGVAVGAPGQTQPASSATELGEAAKSCGVNAAHLSQAMWLAEPPLLLHDLSWSSPDAGSPISLAV